MNFQDYSLCDDGIFRGIFARPGSEGILRDLLNAVLLNADEPTIATLEIKNPFQVQELLEQKETVLDVRATDESNRPFDVEVQTVSHPFFRERILYYWAKMFSEELRKGNDYKSLRPAISIVFIKFPIDSKRPDVLFDSFQIASKNYGVPYGEFLKLHFINVPENVDFLAPAFKSVLLRKWIKALNYPNLTSEEEMKEIAEETPSIGELYNKTQDFMSDETVRYYMLSREKYERDQLSIKNEIKEEALAKGRAEGLEKGLEKGRAEGRAEARADAIVDLLESRFGSDAEKARESLNGKSEKEQRELLLDAATCKRLEDFFARL